MGKNCFYSRYGKKPLCGLGTRTLVQEVPLFLVPGGFGSLVLLFLGSYASQEKAHEEIGNERDREKKIRA